MIMTGGSSIFRGFRFPGVGLVPLVLAFSIHAHGDPAADMQQPAYSATLAKADSLGGLGQNASAAALLERALMEQGDNGSPAELATLHNKLGRYLSLDGNDLRAATHFRLAIEFANEAGDRALLSDAFNNLGIAHEYTGNPDSAFLYYERALGIRETLGDTTRLSASYRNMAQVLRLLMRLEEATRYCRMAYDLSAGIRDFKVVANIYNELAYLYELTGQLDSARHFYTLLIDISRENGFPRGISVGYTNLASVHERENDYERALELKKMGLEIDRQAGYAYGMLTSYRGIAECYLKKQRPGTALAYLDSASALCDSTWLPERMGNEELRYRIYRDMGLYKEALEHYELATAFKDSIFNEKKRKNIAEILTRYETEKKEQQIELLDKNNELKTQRIRIQWIVIIAILLVSLSGALISRLIIKNKNHKLRQMNLELHNYMLRLNDPLKRQAGNPVREEDPIGELVDQFGLTQREAEIMELIRHGLTNQELGDRLFVSSNTIKYHIKNIYIKLDVKNRVQALQKTSLAENHQAN